MKNVIVSSGENITDKPEQQHFIERSTNFLHHFLIMAVFIHGEYDVQKAFKERLLRKNFMDIEIPERHYEIGLG
jgi:hypothetical protein